MPETLGNTSPSSPAATTSAPAASTASTPPPPPPAALGAEPASAPSASPASTAQTASPSLTVRDALANYGYDLRGQFQDDHSALQYLAYMAQQAEQAQQLAQYGQLYLQHADQFQAYLNQQQEKARQELEKQQKSWFEAPEYDPSWQSKIYRDQNGELRVIPGADPSLVQKYLRWVEHQRAFIDKLSQDPIGTIRPGIEQLIDQRAQQIVEARLRQMQEQQYAAGVLQQNMDWLFQRLPNGQIQYNASGKPVLSPVGERYGQYVLLAQNRLGIPDSQRQHEFAISMLQRDVLLGQFQQAMADANPLDANEQLKQQFLNQASQGFYTPASPPNGNVNGSQQPTSLNPRGLEEMMRKEFAAAGIRENDIAP